jgi:hypothetical protein
MTPEKLIENAIKKYIRDSGGWVVKIHAGMEQGKSTLDLLGSLNRKPFLVEVKRVGGVPSLAQEILVTRARMSGYVSGIIESLDEFKALFEE